MSISYPLESSNFELQKHSCGSKVAPGPGKLLLSISDHPTVTSFDFAPLYWKALLCVPVNVCTTEHLASTDSSASADLRVLSACCPVPALVCPLAPSIVPVDVTHYWTAPHAPCSFALHAASLSLLPVLCACIVDVTLLDSTEQLLTDQLEVCKSASKHSVMQRDALGPLSTASLGTCIHHRWAISPST